jgi:hypothetical protein
MIVWEVNGKLHCLDLATMSVRVVCRNDGVTHVWDLAAWIEVHLLHTESID